jgi:hypothetical protein
MVVRDTLRWSKPIRALVAAVALAAPAAPQALLTVDDSGGADYTGIAEALAAAAPGDRILVAAGQYAAFTLDKAVVLVGEGAGALPQVAGLVLVTTTAGGTISTLGLERLHVQGAAGTVLIEDVNVIRPALAPCPAVLVEDSERVAFAGCSMQGGPGDPNCSPPGVEVRDSVVLLTDCVITGGRGANDPLDPGDGAPGVLLQAGADVDVVHSVVTGGTGGKATAPGGTGGGGGPGLRVLAGAAARVLTHDDHNLYAGDGGAGSVPGSIAPFTADGDGVLLSSGATWVPPAFDPALALSFALPELAFLRVVYDDEFGPKQILKLFGVAGEPQVVVGSLVPAAFTAPALVDGLVWLDPGVAFLLAPVSALGLKVPVNFSFLLPPNPLLAGLGATFQAFSDTGGSPPWRATPPSWIVLD